METDASLPVEREEEKREKEEYKNGGRRGLPETEGKLWEELEN